MRLSLRCIAFLCQRRHAWQLHRRFGYAIAYPAIYSAGLPAWKNVSSPGVELLSLTDAGGGVTQAAWAVTYIPAAGPVSPGGSPQAQLATWVPAKLKEPVAGSGFTLTLPNLSVLSCSSNRMFCNAMLDVSALACPSINTTLWGTAAPVVTAPGGQYPLATLVCVTNCGVLPWRLAVTYAAVTAGNSSAGNSTALYAKRQVPPLWSHGHCGSCGAQTWSARLLRSQQEKCVQCIKT